MKPTQLNTLLVAGLLLAGAQLNLHAQLVADGSTTNVTTGLDLSPGDLTVGTNGGTTIVNIIAPGAVTNATGYIGLNASSANNTVTVQNSGAVWNNTGELHIGESGAANQLIVSNDYIADYSLSVNYDNKPSAKINELNDIIDFFKQKKWYILKNSFSFVSILNFDAKAGFFYFFFIFFLIFF